MLQLCQEVIGMILSPKFGFENNFLCHKTSKDFFDSHRFLCSKHSIIFFLKQENLMSQFPKIPVHLIP